MKSLLIPFWLSLLLAVLGPRTAEAAEATGCPIRDLATGSSSLWLLCADGRIAVTDDGGSTWREHAVPSPEQLRGIGALDAQRAFVVGDDGTLLATADGGSTWNQVSVPTEEHLTSVSFLGESGWAAGWGGVMLHTSDGGLTWESQTTSVSKALEQVYFTDSEHGWAVGWVGVILRTVDGGKTWREVRAPEALWSLSSVHFRDSQNGWAVGFMGQLLRSNDGGQTWEKQDSPVQRWLTSIVFDDNERGWIAAEDGVLVTGDGGETWQYIEIQRLLSLTELALLEGSLVAASPSGLLQLTDAGSIMAEPRQIFAFGTGDSESNPDS